MSSTGKKNHSDVRLHRKAHVFDFGYITEKNDQ